MYGVPKWLMLYVCNNASNKNDWAEEIYFYEGWYCTITLNGREREEGVAK